MSVLFNLRNVGGYVWGMGTASIAGTSASMPQTNPLTPITVDKLIVSSDGLINSSTMINENEGVTVDAITINDTDILLSIGGTAQSAPASLFSPKSLINPSINLLVTQQDTVTVTIADNLSASNLNGSASWTGQYSDAGSGIESATPAEAPRFGTGRILAFGSSTSSGATSDVTISGQPNTAQPLILDYFCAQAKTDPSNGTAQIVSLRVDDQDLLTTGSGSVAASVFDSESGITSLFGLQVSSSNLLSVVFNNNGSAGGGFFCSAFACRVAA